MTDRPRVHLVRHGQSEFNAVYDVTGEDPGIVDAGLTELGWVQVASAARLVQALDPTLVVTSPFTRAIETTLGLFEPVTAAPPIVVHPLTRERLGDTCDIGTPASELARRFPMLDFTDLDEVWWHTGEVGERGLAIEPRESLRRRVEAFREWLRDWPEERILLVGHYGFFKRLAGLETRHCEPVEWLEPG